jgi:hypothetical protein
MYPPVRSHGLLLLLAEVEENLVLVEVNAWWRIDGGCLRWRRRR